MLIIESIDEWHDYARLLSKMGYDLWQTQFDIDAPEGFHAWFVNSGTHQIEVATHNKAIYDAIIRYGS